ncbi:MAG: hypothetical protein R3B70_03900 [Polyangiaceae bacterium]
MSQGPEEEVHEVELHNETEQTWTMVVFQILPQTPPADSVSWQQATAPRKGRGYVSYRAGYDVVIASFIDTPGGGLYRSTQTLSAPPGTAWNVVFKDGVQQLEPAGTTAAGQIRMTNLSGRLSSMGVGQSGAASSYRRNVAGNVSVQFVMSPSRWVGLFESAVSGQVVSRDTASVGPLELRFPEGHRRATLTASLDHESVKLTLEYGDIGE